MELTDEQGLLTRDGWVEAVRVSREGDDAERQIIRALMREIEYRDRTLRTLAKTALKKSA